MVGYDSLDARLVMHALYKFFFTDFGSHQSRLLLHPLLASEEILHIDATCPFIISKMSNEYNVLRNIV